jgi:hypothetical protein
MIKFKVLTNFILYDLFGQNVILVFYTIDIVYIIYRG